MVHVLPDPGKELYCMWHKVFYCSTCTHIENTCGKPFTCVLVFFEYVMEKPRLQYTGTSEGLLKTQLKEVLWAIVISV